MSNEQHNAPAVALPTGLPGDIAPPLAPTADALLRDVCEELDALDCGACTGSMAPMEDLHGRIVDHLAAGDMAEALKVMAVARPGRPPRTPATNQPRTAAKETR